MYPKEGKDGNQDLQGKSAPKVSPTRNSMVSKAFTVSVLRVIYNFF